MTTVRQVARRSRDGIAVAHSDTATDARSGSMRPVGAAQRPRREAIVHEQLARRRRRQSHEEIAALLVLAVLLSVVLVMLGMQWLDTGTTANSVSELYTHHDAAVGSAPPGPSYPVHGGTQ